jgi:hypothetical protein
MGNQNFFSKNVLSGFALLLASLISSGVSAALIDPEPSEDSSSYQDLISIEYKSANFAPVYSEMLSEAKNALYVSAIRDVLTEINRDENLADTHISAAHQALTGVRTLYPIDIYGYNGSNTFLLSKTGSKSGLVVFLNSSHERPYVVINGEQDLRFLATNEFKENFSTDNRTDGSFYSGVDTALEGFKSPSSSGWTIKYFNYNNPYSLNIQMLSAELVTRLENDTTSEVDPNASLERKLLYVLARSVRGATLPPLEVTASEVPYRLQIASLDDISASAILRSIATPFASLAKQTRLLIDGTIVTTPLQDIDKNQAAAEAIGTWIDVGVSTVTLFAGNTGSAGVILANTVASVTQSVSLYVANTIDGEANNPLDIISTTLEILPGGKIVTKVKKISSTAGKLIKGGVLVTENGITLINNSLKMKDDIQNGNYNLMVKRVAAIAVNLGGNAIQSKKAMINHMKKEDPNFSEISSTVELTSFKSI